MASTSLWRRNRKQTYQGQLQAGQASRRALALPCPSRRCTTALLAGGAHSEFPGTAAQLSEESKEGCASSQDGSSPQGCPSRELFSASLSRPHAPVPMATLTYLSQAGLHKVTFSLGSPGRS